MLFKHPDFLFSYRVHAYTFSLLIATLLAAGCNLRVVRRMSTITATHKFSALHPISRAHATELCVLSVKEHKRLRHFHL